MNEADDRMDSRGTSVGFLSGLFAGAVIGAGLGLLFAPRAGSVLRGQIAGSAATASKAVSGTVDAMAERGRQLYGRARQVVSRAGDGLDRAMGDGRQNPGQELTTAVEMTAR